MESQANDPTEKIVYIKPIKGWGKINLFDLYRYRELIYFLTWKNIKVRYKQTVLGALWAILQPFLTMVIFSIFFGRLAKIPSDGIPYPLFSFAALVPWGFFSNALTQASNSLVENANLIKKVFFPRLVIPLSHVLSGVVDFVLAFIVLIGMMLYFGYFPTINVIWLPFFLLLAVVTSTGISLWFSAMNIQFRDVRYTLPFITQVWLFATPIAYPSSLLADQWRFVYSMNPMVSVVDGFRWALLGTDTAPPLMSVVISSCVALALLIMGLFYFRRMESSFADVV